MMKLKFNIWSDLTYEKEDILYDIILVLKLIRLGIPPIQIDKIKSSVFYLSLCHCKSQLNYALLGFYLC